MLSLMLAPWDCCTGQVVTNLGIVALKQWFGAHALRVW